MRQARLAPGYIDEEMRVFQERLGSAEFENAAAAFAIRAARVEGRHGLTLSLGAVRSTPAFSGNGFPGKDLTGRIRVAGLAQKEVAVGAVSLRLVAGELGLVDLARILHVAEGLGRRVGVCEVGQLRAP